MQNTFFSSDMHFMHKNIIKYCKRPCADLDEMHEMLITNHNSRVKPTDHWWHLGDFIFGGAEKARYFLSRLNGIKHFIPGNHDNIGMLIQLGKEGLLDEVRPDFIGKINNHRFHMYHFPIQSWEGARHGVIHLHGHSHGSTPSPDMLRLDVGVDCNNLFPFSYEEIARWADDLLPKLKNKDISLDPGRDRDMN